MLTAGEWRVLVALVVIALTLGAFVMVILFMAACAVSGLSDAADDGGLDDIEHDLEQWRAHRDAPPVPVTPASLRDVGYYTSAAHAARAERITRAMGDDDAAA